MQRIFHRALSTATRASDNLLAISQLRPAMPRKARKRVGRGVGSDKGKLSGSGHQKSLSTPRGFEGGQTPLYRRLPKIGFTNFNKLNIETVNLDRIQSYIDMGKLKPKENDFITMRHLMEAGVISKTREGVKLLGNGKDVLRTPIHLEVSQASQGAIEGVEKAGGTVTCVHFNKLAYRALMKPSKLDLFPIRARPSGSAREYYLDRTKCGYMSPEIQRRNIEKFGKITSEEDCRKEHEDFAKLKQRMRNEEWQE